MAKQTEQQNMWPRYLMLSWVPFGAKIALTHNTFVHTCDGNILVFPPPSSIIVILCCNELLWVANYFVLSASFCLHAVCIFFKLEVDDWQPLFTAYEKSCEQVKHILQHWDLAHGVLLVPLPDNEPSLVPREAASKKQVDMGLICHLHRESVIDLFF